MHVSLRTRIGSQCLPEGRRFAAERPPPPPTGRAAHDERTKRYCPQRFRYAVLTRWGRGSSGGGEGQGVGSFVRVCFFVRRARDCCIYCREGSVQQVNDSCACLKFDALCARSCASLLPHSPEELVSHLVVPRSSSFLLPPPPPSLSPECCIVRMCLPARPRWIAPTFFLFCCCCC